MVMKKRPTAYDRGQHELICAALGISADPKAPGLTAYEGVCVLLTKIDAAKHYLAETRNKSVACKQLLKTLEEPVESETFCALRMYGTQ